MWLFWFLQPHKPIRVFILDKTVLTPDALEHKCFDWILNHERFVKSNDEHFNRAEDYYGFFPKTPPYFETHDLEDKSDAEVACLHYNFDMAYFTDTYGIYTNEWNLRENETERSKKIYGGFTKKELQLLKEFRASKKLVISEYNLFASPTSADVRSRTEEELKLKWSGWTARHFESLDTVNNPDLPRWVIKNYLNQNNNQWPFKKGGMVFNHLNETIVILEEDKDLKEKTPIIYTNVEWQKYYGIPAKIDYPYWLDIIQAEDSTHVKANYHLETTYTGDTLLQHFKIPKIFPAVIAQKNGGEFYYFAGDFCDNPVSFASSYFAGITGLKAFFYSSEPDDRKGFFWNYYRPLVTKIMLDYYKTLYKKS